MYERYCLAYTINEGSEYFLSDLQSSYDPMRFVLLFAHGELGWAPGFINPVPASKRCMKYLPGTEAYAEIHEANRRSSNVQEVVSEVKIL